MTRRGTDLHVRLGTFAATIAGLVACPAEAQNPDSPAVIDEIVVTATRRESSIRDVPFNIAAVPGVVLERRGLRQLNEVAHDIPGLTVVDQGPRAASRMTARGLNVASLNESAVLFNSSGNTVATYLGEIPIYIDYRMRDLDRVEVLLGPQGTLYGAGTLGGAIRYIPNEPDTKTWEAFVAMTGFGQDQSDGVGSDFHAVVNAPILEDRLALRVSLSRYHDPGFTDYPYLVREPGTSNPQPDLSDPADVSANLVPQSDVDSGDTTNLRVALRWNPRERLQATLNYFFQETEFGGRSINHRQALGTGRYEAASRVVEPVRRENHLTSLELSADLGFAGLVSATGVSYYRELGQRDQTDLGLLIPGLGLSDFPNFIDIASDSTREQRFNQELRLISSGPGPIHWIAGAYYNDFEFDHELNELAPGYADFLGISRPDDLLAIIRLEQEQKEFALFGELAYDVTDRWQIAAGIRRFDFRTIDGAGDDYPLLFTADGIYGPEEINVNVQRFESSDTGTQFKLNTSYRFTDDLSAYLTISEGYRLGGENAAPRCPEPPPATPFPCLRPNETSFDPDTTINYEAGVRARWLEGRLQANAAIYYIDWNDVQLDIVSEDFFFITVNGGDARSRGLEMSLATTLSERWDATVSYAHNNAELTSIALGAVDGADGFAGDRLAGTPRHQLAARLVYSRPVLSDWEMTIDYGLAYTGDVYTKTGLRNNGEILPSFTIHNMSATMAGRNGWSFRLFVDNLFDKFAETNVRGDPGLTGNVGVHPLRWYYRNVLRPRRYGAEVRYDFNLN